MTKAQLFAILANLPDDALVYVCPRPDDTEYRGEIGFGDLHQIARAGVVNNDGPVAPAFGVIDAKLEYQ